jgi:hypothetical protein
MLIPVFAAMSRRLSAVEKAEAKKRELLSTAPEARKHAKVLAAMPNAARQYRDQMMRAVLRSCDRPYRVSNG